MKNVILATILMAGLVSTASALDVGVTGGFDDAGKRDTSTYGVTVGQKYGALGVALEADRSTRNKAMNNRLGVIASYDVAQVAGITVAPKVGLVALNPERGDEGYGAVAGVGGELNLGSKFALSLDYRYQWGQDRVGKLDGNRVFAGVKYRF